jgi:enoyl-CoA hydratase
MARDGGRIGVTELLVGVPFPPAAMEIMRCAAAPQALLERAVAAANVLAALPPKAFALTKRQIRAPALERMRSPELDAAITQIWTAPETLDYIRDYVARTLRKS